MRKLILSLVFVPFCCYSQKALRDDAMRAQERRQVYMQWGDWNPKAKYIFGIQINPKHTLVWGWMADIRPGNKNKSYKNGNDIRPLGPTGKQTLRLAALAQQQSITDQMVKESDEIGGMAVKEILYYSNTAVQADPLYLLYFKKTLKPIAEFSQSNLQSECGRADIYDFLNETGVINSHIREMNILKNRLDGLFSSNIERGQRIIMYHRLLTDYRSEKNTWDRHIMSTKTFLDLKAKNVYNKGSLPPNGNPFNGNWEERDRQIARQVIEEAKYNSL